jgi:Flp pilus assembly protein TadD
MLILLSVAPQMGCMTLPAMLTPPNPVLPTAESSAKAAKSLPPNEGAHLCLQLAETMEQRGYYAEAANQCEKARQLNPKLDLSYRLALLYDQMGDGPRALTEYQRAVSLKPRDANLLSDLGYCYYNNGNWAEAEKALRQALEIDGKHQRARINLGLTLGMQGQYDEALETFSSVVSPAEAHCNLAFVFLTQGKRDEAQQAYRKALTLDPNHPLARAALAKFEETDHKEAAVRPQAEQKRAAPVMPPNPDPDLAGPPPMPHRSAKGP